MVFPMEDMGEGEFSHEYLEHLETLGQGKRSLAVRIVTRLKHFRAEQLLLPFLWVGRLTGVRRPGTITYYRADMCQMEAIKDASMDAVVSVSAIEHIEKEKIALAAKEFERVLKPGGTIAVTTSAARDEDWFHEPSKGWCFTEKTLQDDFNLNSSFTSNYDRYDELFEKLRSCDRLRGYLADIYFKSGNNGMPWGVWDPKYQPVGILIKRKGA
jgi:SAM-dependent methyltransferase